MKDFLRTRYAPHLERSQFSDLVAECKEILVGVGKTLESMTVEGPESEVDEPESGPEVVAELVSPQEDISSWPIEVEDLPTETLVDLLAESTMKLVPSLATKRASLFLRTPNEYDHLQIFLQETVSREVGTLICRLNFSRVDLLYYIYLA